MPKALPTQQEILEAIRKLAQSLDRAPSRSEFKARSGMTEYHVLLHFPSWSDAIRAAGLSAHTANQRLDDADLLRDWGDIVRKLRRIPTRVQYRRDGQFSAVVFEKHFGPWSGIPDKFRAFAGKAPEWADVLALLPQSIGRSAAPASIAAHEGEIAETTVRASARHAKLDHRPTYGNPIDFRGLRHEPVNEQGVVFLFGMLAHELGYSVEAVQTGFPDCEAKRQVGPGKWQRVRIEFEFESRNFRDHGHDPSLCDVIVCWRHNWTECPSELEIVELATLVKSLPGSED